MSEDLTDFTPPVTPTNEFDISEEQDIDFRDGIFDENLDGFLKRFSFRWFNCSGEDRQELRLNEDSIICSGEEFVFDLNFDDKIKLFLKKNDYQQDIELFGFSFDKGSALLCNMELLFKFARSEFMKLDSCANTYVKFGVIKQDRGPLESRKHLIQFFLYIRQYLYNLLSNKEKTYCDILKHLRHILSVKLYSFRCLMRRIVDLPEYIYQHAAAAVVQGTGSQPVRSSYHVFHSHLDLRWFHLTVILYLNNGVNEPDDMFCDDVTLSSGLSSILKCSQLVGPTSVEFYVNYLVSELIQLAILRFEKIDVKDVLKSSPFNCTCVRELWLLIQLLIEDREKEVNSDGFWTVLNKMLTIILGTGSQSIVVKEIGALKLPDGFPCSNPSIFVLWLMNHLSVLYMYNAREMKSNYTLLETSLKEILKTDVPENLLQLYISFTHNLCFDLWEIKIDPILLFWDYFQRRLNNSFYLPGSSLDTMAVISKSPIGLISQIQSRLSGDKQNNSYEQFLQLLGTFITKTKDNTKYWNQLKGRIYSKFTMSKISALNESGLHHFVSLLLTMAMAKDDISEVCKKLQEFLQLIDEDMLDINRKRLVWQTHLAVLLLLAEKQCDLTEAINPLKASVRHLDIEKNLPLMKMFVDGFQDLIDTNNGINLGLSNLIDDWIPRYLTVCFEESASSLLNTLLIIIRRLKNKQQPFEPQESELFERLWSQTKPYIERTMRTSVECPVQVGELAADLGILSIKISHTALNFREMVNLFALNEVINIRLLRRFLCQLIEYKPLRMALPNHDVFIVKMWIKCLILSTDTTHSELTELTNYMLSLPELRAMGITWETSLEPLDRFFCGLRKKYDQLNDIIEKKELRDRVARYFDGIKEWLQHPIKVPKCSEVINRIYTSVGRLISHIGPLIYVKSHPKPVLQTLIDLLLLPLYIRKPEYKLNPMINSAIKSSLILYVQGLVKLGVDHDEYITRTVQEMIVIYLPRCVPSPSDWSVINLKSFSLIECFNDNDKSKANFKVAKFVLDTIRVNFFKQRVRSPPSSCRQGLIFVKEILLAYGYTNFILSLIIPYCLDNVCSIIIYCEERNPCKTDATDIVLQILNCELVRKDNQLGEEIMKMFSKLCKEHLAFSSRQLFSLFTTIISSGPDLIFRFLPNLLKHINEVESKRGVGYDRALRAEYENLQKTLNDMQR